MNILGSLTRLNKFLLSPFLATKTKWNKNWHLRYFHFITPSRRMVKMNRYRIQETNQQKKLQSFPHYEQETTYTGKKEKKKGRVECLVNNIYQNSERILTRHLCLCIIGWTCLAILSRISFASFSPAFFRALISQTLLRSPTSILWEGKFGIPQANKVTKLQKLDSPWLQTGLESKSVNLKGCLKQIRDHLELESALKFGRRDIFHLDQELAGVLSSFHGKKSWWGAPCLGDAFRIYWKKRNKS